MKIFHYDWGFNPEFEIIFKGAYGHAHRAAREGRYRWTASVSDDLSLEEAYCATQNDIECRDGVSPSWRGVGRHRSTSVGDIVVKGDDVFVVQGCGFKKVHDVAAQMFQRAL